MGIGMRMEQVQSLTPEMRQNLKSEQRLAMTQQLKQSLDLLQLQIIGDPAETLEELVESVLATVPEGNLREGVSYFLQDKVFQEMLLEKSAMIVSGGVPSAHSFSVDYMHKKMDGLFSLSEIEKDDEGEQAVTDHIKVNRGEFSKACLDQKAFQDEMRGLRDYVEKVRDNSSVDTSGAIRRMGEIRDALRAATACRDEIKSIEEVATFMLIKKDDGGRSIKEFLKDYAIMRDVGYFISERMQKRFVTKCMKLTGNNTASHFESAFLNSIGEYVLTCTGVIDPDLFSSQKCDLDLEDYLELKERMKLLGVNLDKKMEDSNFKQSGTIFFNRWKVIGQKADIVTDEKIREFITQTVRESKEVVLDAAKYLERFSEIREIVQGKKNGTEKEDMESELRELFVNTLIEDDFQKKIVSLSQTHWRDALNVFLQTEK